MSNERFTQGEWRVARRNVHGITTIFVGVKIGNEYIDVGSANDNEDKANAHLIAAAPDMYRVLQDALFLLESYVVQIEGEWGCGRSLEKIEADGDLPEEILAIRAALAKANGGG